TAVLRGRTHDFTLGGKAAIRRLSGRVANGPVTVEDLEGRMVRTVTFGPATSFAVRDAPISLLARDVWHAANRVQIDMGARLDHRGRHRVAPIPTGRIGIRYALDEAALTVVKAGYGGFVGNLPLAVEAVADYPTPTDSEVGPAAGEVLAEASFGRGVDRLRQPRAKAGTIGIERQLVPSLDASVSFVDRRSNRLPTLEVPAHGGQMVVRGNGEADYREVQLSARKQWKNDQQLFVSY